MIRGIDHVVLAVPDPDAAATLLEERLGLEPAPGGRHAALGTVNRLVWLGDSYLELLGVFDEGLAAASWLGRPTLEALADGGEGGLVAWSIAVDDLDAVLRWLPSDHGLTGPIDGARTRPDGREVRWRLAHPDPISPSAPFLIEHDPTGAEWTRDERAARAEATHPVGGRARLATVELRTDRLAPEAGRLRRLLGTHAQPEGRKAVRIAIGAQAIRLAPAAADGEATAAIELLTEVPLRARKVRIGSCEIRLRGEPPARPATVDDATDAAEPVV